MPKKNVPSYCRHRGSGQAYVKIAGKRIYLGRHGTAESHRRYAEEIAKWQSQQTEASENVTIGQLSLLFFRHCEGHYRKNGELTSEYQLIRLALRHVNRRHKDEPADSFTPMKLEAIRDAMIESGEYCRKSINDYCKRIVLCWKWGVRKGYVKPSTWHALTTVGSLQKGRTAARESDPVRPVPVGQVEAVQPFLAEPLRGVVEFQLCTAARPSEALNVRIGEIDRSGGVWVYTPGSHKTAHHNKSRVILIGPKGQDVVLRHAGSTDPEAFVFSKPDGKPYRRDSYKNAIARGCEKAFSMPPELRNLKRDADPELKKKAAEWRKANCWRPNMLRHTAATTIRREAGSIEAAKTILGHASIDITEIYAERDLVQAAEIIAKIG